MGSHRESTKVRTDFKKYLQNFSLKKREELFDGLKGKTEIQFVEIQGKKYPRFINEYWTAKQRQASSLHEIAYRACFKGQLPAFFIQLLTKKNDLVYDPFSGRGTTLIEAALLGRRVIGNDINPLSKILTLPRLSIPSLEELEERLHQIPVVKKAKGKRDLSMFYHPGTEAEILSLRNYLMERKEKGEEDFLDRWIRMVATNRITGHSPGFFSVYTLPPNQAVSPESQKKINEKRDQKPSYRDTKKLILKKTRSLKKDLSSGQIKGLRMIGRRAFFLTTDARKTSEIKKNSVQLTVTSPPFLDVVQYDQDNWLRCWFNNIDGREVAGKITQTRSLEEWCKVMAEVFVELYRITKPGGWVAFEVGEVRGGKIRLDEYVVPLGLKGGFRCEGIVINQQAFTKTSNIWGVENNTKGTNTNRVVLFQKA